MSLFGLGRKGSLITRPTLCFAVCYASRFLCCICVHLQEVSAGFTKDNDVMYRCCLHANAMHVSEHNGYLCLCAVALSWVLRFDSFFCRFLLDSIENALLLSCHDPRPEVLILELTAPHRRDSYWWAPLSRAGCVHLLLEMHCGSVFVPYDTRTMCGSSFQCHNDKRRGLGSNPPSSECWDSMLTSSAQRLPLDRCFCN